MNTTTTEQQPTSLLLRATALKRRTRKPRLHSFCLPKENTVALLDFHCEDEPENDVSSSSFSVSSTSSEKQPQQQPQPSMTLNRRKISLKQRNHKKQRKNSFRVPSEMTQQLLLLKFANKLESNEDTEDDMDQSEPATVTCPPAAPHADDPKLRRVRAMQKYLAKVSRRKSFSLPKETTKLLLQIKDTNFDEDDDDEDEFLEEEPVAFPTPELVEEEATAVEEAVRIAQEARDALKMAMEDEEQYLQWAAEENYMEESFPTPQILAEEAFAANEAERIAQEAQDMLKQALKEETQYQSWAKDMRIKSFQRSSSPPKEEERNPTINVSNSKKIVRCQSLKEHTHKIRLTSFRVPHENIKSLLHLFVSSCSDGDDSSEEFKTALPRKIIRKSSFNACTA